MYNSRIQNTSKLIDETGAFASIHIQGGSCEIHNSTLIVQDYGLYIDSGYESTIYGSHFENDGVELYSNGIYIVPPFNRYEVAAELVEHIHSHTAYLGTKVSCA